VCWVKKKSHKEAKEISCVPADDLFKLMLCSQLFFLFGWQEIQI
jgi:hypothetical protein